MPLKVIRDEYERGSPQVLKKLDWLQEKGWDQVWRARGDGDCFYRCKWCRMRRLPLSLTLLYRHTSLPELLPSADPRRIAFTLAYLLRILHDPEPALAANLAFDAIQRALPAMQQAGFDPDLVRAF